MVAGRLRLDSWEEYAAGTRGEHFEWWAAEHLILGQDRFAGSPLVLEQDWQAPIMYEALAVNPDGSPYWRTVVNVWPRKNAKTATLGALSDYELDNGVGEPEILLAAGSNKQADKLFQAASGFIRRSGELRGRMVVRAHDGQIVRADGGGTIYRLSSEGDTQHGANPSLVILDELHVWRTPKLRRSWGALTTAGGARSQTQVFAITTEGEASGRDLSILGMLVDENERTADLERHPGLTISRNHESRTIVFRFHAVDKQAADPRPLRKARAALKKAETAAEPLEELEAECSRLERSLLDSVMPANPASWITEEYILRQARAGEVMPADFMQLHANVAADSTERWIPAELWAELEDAELEIPAGATVCVAVDAALSHDSTAVAWAWLAPDDRVAVRCHVWCARPGAAAHTFVPGGRIRNDAVKTFIRELAQRYKVAELVYDPRFFEDAAMDLSDEGLDVAPLNQGTANMRDAEQQFHDAALEHLLAHDGDVVLTQHVAATVATKTDHGWKIRKLQQSKVIDALVASVMAHYRARRMVSAAPWIAAW